MDTVKMTISSTFLRRYHPDQVQRVQNTIPSQSEEDSPSGTSYVISVIISDKMENATFTHLICTGDWINRSCSFL